jgi:uncharacterized protein YjbJ (UPF0337 family)
MQQEKRMNKDQGKGTVQKAKGKVREVAGAATGDRSLEAKGKLDQAAGSVRKGYGDVKEEFREEDNR